MDQAETLKRIMKKRTTSPSDFQVRFQGSVPSDFPFQELEGMLQPSVRLVRGGDPLHEEDAWLILLDAVRRAPERAALGGYLRTEGDVPLWIIVHGVNDPEESINLFREWSLTFPDHLLDRMTYVGHSLPSEQELPIVRAFRSLLPWKQRDASESCLSFLSKRLKSLASRTIRNEREFAQERAGL